MTIRPHPNEPDGPDAPAPPVALRRPRHPGGGRWPARLLCVVLGALAAASLFPAPAAAAVTPAAGESVTFFHHDALGSPMAASDERGRLLWHEGREPYGRALGRVTAKGRVLGDVARGGEAGAVRRDPGYTGHVDDGGSRLTYMQQRHYDPVLGRFLSNDPAGVDGGAARTFNRYAYANNNPYSYVDPDGEAAVPLIIGLGVAGLIFVAADKASKDGLGALEQHRSGNSSSRASSTGLLSEQVSESEDRSSSNDSDRTPSPALNGDPYSPEQVEERQAEWADAYTDPIEDAAAGVGFGQEVPRQRAPFNSHGQRVFTDGDGYISPDHTEHKVSNGWKSFDRSGNRTGTWNSDLTDRIGR